MDTSQVSAWADKLIDLCTSVGSKIVLALLILFRYKDEDFSFLKKHSGRTKTEE